MECLHRYCVGLDERRWELFEEVFHEDGVCELSAFGGAWREWLAQAKELLLRATLKTHHQIGNLLVVEADGGLLSESYVTAHHVVRADAPRDGFLGGTGEVRDVIIGSRYVDRFELRRNGWRIVRRKSVVEWGQIEFLNSTGLG